MEKIKQFVESDKGRNILIIIIIILVGLGSFQLGKLSKNNVSSSGVKVSYPPIVNTEILPKLQKQDLSKTKAGNVVASAIKTQNTINTEIKVQNFFASKQGRKYYSANCSAGKAIKKENRIYFSTSMEAERAGYILSSSCD